jgi:type II secretory pathway component GspD/PulD (secretin)
MIRIKEILESLDLEKDYTKEQYKKTLNEINNIVNEKFLGMEVIVDKSLSQDEFKLVDESELSQDEINGAISLE